MNEQVKEEQTLKFNLFGLKLCTETVEVEKKARRFCSAECCENKDKATTKDHEYKTFQLKSSKKRLLILLIAIQ